MSTTEHPITPPPELVRKWLDDFHFPWPAPGLAAGEATLHIATEAARWGADQELEACCAWLDIPNNRRDRGDGWLIPGRLRAARRPKPPSLKGQSLELIDLIQGNTKAWDIRDLDVVRRALQQLPD